MIDETPQQLQDQINETTANYSKVVQESLIKSKAAQDRAIEFRKKCDFEDVNTNNPPFKQYIHDVSEAIFGPCSAEGYLCWINSETLNELFEKIETDKRVKIFFKDFAWRIIVLYRYARTCGELLNKYFPVTVNRKPTNSINRKFLLNQDRAKVRMPYRWDKLKLAKAENQKRRDQFRLILTGLNLPSDEESGIDGKAMIEAMVSGDIRKIQKQLSHHCAKRFC